MTKRYAKIAAALPQQAASNFETTLNEYLLPERAEIVSWLILICQFYFSEFDYEVMRERAMKLVDFTLTHLQRTA